MSYLVLARKWRPGKFSEVVGQEHVTETLQNSIRSGRIVQAFLFTGVRGVGKTTIARILAKALNCTESDGPAVEPCGECTACKEISSGSAVDVQEIDGASNNSVDDVRSLRENAQYMPSSLRYKVYIIDEVHMLSKSAFNALLKILEEPPPHVVFMFATTDPQKIPITILSRCQRYDLKRLKSGQIAAQIRKIAEAEGFDMDDSAVRTLAAQADGSMRDALSLLDQIISFAGTSPSREQVREILGAVDRELVKETVQALLSSDAAGALDAAHKALQSGCSEKVFLGELAAMLRNLAVAKACPDRPDLLDMEHEEAQSIMSLAKDYDQRALHLLFDAAGRGMNEVSYSNKPTLTLEMTLLRMTSALPLQPLDKLIQKLDKLMAGTSQAVAIKKNSDTTGGAGSSDMRCPEPEDTRVSRTSQTAPHDSETRAATAPDPGPGAPLEQRWAHFLDFLKQDGGISGQRLARVLEHASVAAMSRDQVKLAVQQNFHKQEIERKASAIENKLSEFMGGKVKLVLLSSSPKATKPLAEIKEADRKKRITEKRQKVLRHPNVIEVQEILGGRVVGVTIPEEED